MPIVFSLFIRCIMGTKYTNPCGDPHDFHRTRVNIGLFIPPRISYQYTDDRIRLRMEKIAIQTWKMLQMKTKHCSTMTL